MGVCVGVCGCGRVFAGVGRCSQVCVGVCRCGGVRGCAGVCMGVGGSAQVWAGVQGCARLCMGVRRFARRYACVGGMNFQNFFWRIESLHQRTLKRILYEFFFVKSRSAIFGKS